MVNNWGQRGAAGDRKSRLPNDWAKRRKAVLARDGGRCMQMDGDERCPQPATDVDHIVPGDNHSLDNLQAMCGPHHRTKTAREAALVRAEKYSTKRKPEKHPGLL